MNAGQLPGQDAGLVEGCPGLLPAHAEPARAGGQIREGSWVDPGRVPAYAQGRLVKIIPRGHRRHRRFRQAALLHFRLCHIAAALQPQPPVFRPVPSLQGGLPPQGAAIAGARIRVVGDEGPGRQVGQPGLPARQVHVAGVAGLLQIAVRVKIMRLQMVPVRPLVGLRGLRGEHRALRIGFIGAPDALGPGHGRAVVVARPALRAHEIVIVPVPGQVGRLDAAAVRGAAPDPPGQADDLAHRRVIFHHADGAGLFVAVPGLPLEGDDVLSPVGVMQHGRVESGRMQVDRLAPGPPDVLRGDHVIIDVKIAGIHGVHDAVDHIEEVLRLAVGQAGGPDAFGGGKSLQVRILRICEGVGAELPVFHIAGMVDGDAGEPLEGGHGNIEIIAFAADAGIGVEARQDGISDHDTLLFRRSCRHCLNKKPLPV